MTNLFIDQNEINIELNAIEQDGANLELKLTLLSQKIKYIFSLIKESNDPDLINDYFLILDIIQSTLGKIQYEYKLGLPERLAQFVHDFDNLEIDKEYYLKKIKSGEYFLKNTPGDL